MTVEIEERDPIRAIIDDVGRSELAAGRIVRMEVERMPTHTDLVEHLHNVARVVGIATHEDAAMKLADAIDAAIAHLKAAVAEFRAAVRS